MSDERARIEGFTCGRCGATVVHLSALLDHRMALHGPWQAEAYEPTETLLCWCSRRSRSCHVHGKPTGISRVNAA